MPKESVVGDVHTWGPYQRWQAAQATEFAPPVLVAALPQPGQPLLRGVMVSCAADDVMQWRVAMLPNVGTDTMALGELERQQGETIMSRLLLRVCRPDGRLVWYPWQVCNPHNCFSFTVLAPVARRAVEVGPALACARAIFAGLPVIPRMEAWHSWPAQPPDGVASRAALLPAAVQQRQCIYAPSADADAPEVAERCDSMGVYGAPERGFEEVDVTPEDRWAGEGRAAVVQWGWPALERSQWTERDVRMFFYVYASSMRLGDCTLPTLCAVIMQRHNSCGTAAVLCRFAQARRAVWVARRTLEQTAMLVEATCAVVVRDSMPEVQRRQLSAARLVARGYVHAMAAHDTGAGRPPSPGPPPQEPGEAEGDYGDGKAADAESLWELAHRNVAARADAVALDTEQLDALVRVEVHRLQSKRRRHPSRGEDGHNTVAES